jgi:hypothetical protein
MNIKSPVDPHLKKFLIFLTGKDTLVVSRNNDFTSFIMPEFVVILDKEQGPKPKGEIISLELSDHLIQQKRFFLTNKGSVMLNEKIKDSFMYFFYNYMYDEVKKGEAINESVYRMLNDLDMTIEECNPENLIRYYRRDIEKFLAGRFVSRKKVLEQLHTVTPLVR